MPVTVAANNTRVESNHVYVMPCNVTLTIDKGILRTRELDPMNRERKPIDIFLVSLALGRLFGGGHFVRRRRRRHAGRKGGSRLRLDSKPPKRQPTPNPGRTPSRSEVLQLCIAANPRVSANFCAPSVAECCEA